MSKRVSYGANVTHNYDKVDPRGSDFYKTYGEGASYYQTKGEETANRKMKDNETPFLYGKWTPEHAGTTGYFTQQRYTGGKKTKRKRSRRTKKSRRHRKK
jgi:hypothetical protein